jgi:hypothetical protein
MKIIKKLNSPNMDKITAQEIPDQEPIHTWFELSYAQYLTIPRSVLQSMPTQWQQRFVDCLNQLDESIDWRPKSGRYWVKLKNGNGQYVTDPLMDYERGRRKIPLMATPTEQPGIEEELAALREWKREAIAVMPDMQKIGKLLNVPLGQSVHDKIIPGIESLLKAQGEQAAEKK